MTNKDYIHFYRSHSVYCLRTMLPSDINKWHEGRILYLSKLRKKASKFNTQDEIIKTTQLRGDK